MFNLNLTYSMIILLFVYDTCALYYPNEATLNVGTVLFRPNDLNKTVWSPPDIQLLVARKRFQNILPLPRSADTLNEYYIDELIKYFKNSFATIKRETTDSVVIDVMEKALADTIAGFFKVWVLPVTKYAYYGGSVSEDDALHAFQFYENLKAQLNTDGNGWRSPDESILNSIAISVIPFAQLLHTRSMRDPCQHLAYYEKNNKSLAIPTPYINWSNVPNAMFLPLRNESVILLNSPSSSKALLKYYDIAESCCQLNTPNECDDFNSRFQHWLSNDVVPHLNDDGLYFAFRSVLSLLDKTKQLFAKITDSSGSDYNKCNNKSLLPSIPPCMTSKKFLILFAVLFIELVWCVPTLLYLYCCRKKTKTRKRSQFFLDIFKRRKSRLYKCQTVERIDRSVEKRDFINKNSSTRSLRLYQPSMKNDSVKFIQKPRSQIIDIDTQYPSNTSKRSVGQTTESSIDIINKNQSVIVINELRTRSSMRKNSLNAINSSEVQTRNSLSNAMNITNTDQTSITTVEKLDTTITKIVRDKSDDKNMSYINRSSFQDTAVIVSSENIQKPDGKDETNDVCPCVCCLNEDKSSNVNVIEDKSSNEESSRNRSTTDIKKPGTERKMRVVNKTGHLSKTGAVNKTGAINKTGAVNKMGAVGKTGAVRKHANTTWEQSARGRKIRDNKKTVVLPREQTKDSSYKNIKMNHTKGLRLNSGEPLLEIRIDKPAAEITVDINKTSGATKRNARASKIPRRAAVGGVTEEYGRKNLNADRNYLRPCVCPDFDYKRHTVTKRSADEMDIKREKVAKYNKMNVTI